MKEKNNENIIKILHEQGKENNIEISLTEDGQMIR
jgi:hypothetical protein